MKAASWHRILLAVLVIGACVVAYTASSSAASSGHNSRAARSNFITVGSFGPLSGASTDLGTGVVNAVHLALDQANKNGGVKLKNGKRYKFKLETGDDQGDPQQALSVVQKMLSDHVSAIVGGVVSATVLAVMDPVSRAGVPFINASGAAIAIPQTIASKNYTNIFSASPDTDERGFGAADLISHLLKAKTVAFVNEGGDAGRADAAHQTQYYSNNARTVQVVDTEFIDPTQTDFSTVLNKVRSLNPSVIYSETYGAATPALGKQICQQGISAQMVLGFAPVDYGNQVGSGCANGTIIMTVWSPTAAITKLTKGFVLSYTTRYGAAPGYWAAQAYDATLMLIQAYKTAGTTNNASVVKALGRVKILGVRGHLHFSSVRNGHKTTTPLVFSQYRNGNYRTIWPAKYATARYVPVPGHSG